MLRTISRALVKLTKGVRSSSTGIRRLKSRKSPSVEHSGLIEAFLETQQENEAGFIKEKDESVPAFSGSEEKHIPDKALALLGDDYLMWRSKNAVTEEIKANVKPKTLCILGDKKLLSRKQEQLLGDPFTYELKGKVEVVPSLIKKLV